MAALALSGITTSAALAEDSPVPTFPGMGSLDPPASLGVDVTTLVPPTVELATPVVCGDLTVYDEEDLATLCSPATLAATPIVSPTCPQVVSGAVRLETDLVCADTSGLIVGSDNTVIDLNGHRISCVAPGNGYQGSCQGQGPNGVMDDDADRGVEVDGFDNVHVFSHREGGTINGFDIGVAVFPGSDNVKVKQLIVTGPPIGAGPRPRSFGIAVGGVDCGGGNIRLGGGRSTGNDISNQEFGINLFQSACVYVGYNSVHDIRNAFPQVGEAGILLHDSPDNLVRGNRVTRVGEADVGAGIFLFDNATVGNLIDENAVNDNLADGIATERASGNYIVNNQMLRNGPPPHADASSDQTSVNRWNENNRCLTQTTPQPPPGVCGTPNDVPPPQ